MMFIYKKTFLCLFIYVINSFHVIYCANILVLAPVPSVSHSYIMIELAKSLVERNHNVDVVSNYRLKEPIDGYTDISIQDTSTLLTDALVVEYAEQLNGITLIANMIEICGTGACKSAFQSPQLQELKNSTKKYDVLITEHFAADCMLGFAWHFDVPSVLVEASIIFPWTTDRFGLPDNPSYIPTHFVEYTSEMSFFQRLINTWHLMQAKILYDFLSTRPSEQLARDFFGPKMPSLQELAYNNSLMLANTHFSINDARPLVPNVIEVAGLHIADPKPLSQYYNEVLSTDLHGVIYFTMGSIVAVETFPDKTLQHMFEAMSELPFKVLVRARRERFPKGLNIPVNIHFETWMPQLDILCDPRVKLFISHGGMMSTQEAVYCGVPILGIPLFADQKSNTKHAEKLGYALTITDITKDIFLAAARKLLFNPKYAQNAKKISEDFKDRPMTPKDTAIYWIEYVIKHKGAPKLQSAAKYLAWYQYYLIDIIAAVIGVPYLLMYLFYRLLKRVACRKNHRN